MYRMMSTISLVCEYLPRRVCCPADGYWHHSVEWALEEVVPTRPFEGRTAAGCYEGAGQHPFPLMPEPDHLHRDTQSFQACYNS